ncbi:type VII secretion integral membrane protein EccD [Streptomyces sp. 1114.5]|uniref:type VII secretion integral membrane protein EccD n=1 Tax=Streptomyces sp. 1114.5 TaxID=1938830 RepID=UPI000EADE967|nr:type VII secretion integral membrane protein EccD [Streptomyces sp. 1114.5]RKT16557.1 type VII secretion integral membrane protein EccD [Streptomyces sp. 1114.5]
MSGTTVASGLVRLRFRAPETAFELALPGDVVLADLLGAVLDYAGAAVEESGTEHSGWVLQRIGGPPLDEERTLEGLGLRDGEELFLRPGQEALPEVHFDDLVDGVRAGTTARGDSWRPAVTHHLALALALVALAGGLLLLALPGPDGPRCAAAAVVAVLLLGAGGAVTRLVADPPAGIALGAAGVAYAAAAAALLPGVTGPARLLAGGSAAVGATVLALAVIGAGPFFAGLAVAAVLALGSGALAAYGVPTTHSAAVIAAAAVLFGAFVPGLAFKLGGLRLPALPRNADELQEEIEPFPAEDVFARSLVADSYLAGFFVAVGAVCAGALALLATARDGGWGATAMSADLSLLLLLHARDIGGVRQRLALLLPGALGLALLAWRTGQDAEPSGRFALFAVLVVVAAGLAVAAWAVPGRRLLPYWGRAGDLLHSLAALALLPFALQVLGFYRMMRGLAG